jgi:hypothetical protein
MGVAGLRRRDPGHVGHLVVVFTVLLGALFAQSTLPAQAQTEGEAGIVTVQQVTVGAAGGPFEFELSGPAPSPEVRQGAATTTAEGAAVDVTGLEGDLAAGTYTLREDLAQLPAEPAGGSWEFTGVECDGAPVTVDAATATATITLDAGASPTCVVTDTFVATDAATPAETTTTTTAPGDTSTTTTATRPSRRRR